MDTQDESSEQSAPGVTAPDSGSPELLEVLAEKTAVTAQEAGKAKPPATPLQESLYRLGRDRRAMMSIGMILLFIVIALAGPPIYQRIGGLYNSPTTGLVGPDRYHTFDHQELTRQDEGPSRQYWLGTDSLGRDLLARLMQGMLISLTVAFMVELVDITLGVLIGVLAGYHGSWIDQLLARFTDVMFAFPGVLFVILLTGIFGSWADDKLSAIPIVGENGNARLLLVSLGLAFTVWPLMARYVRGQTLQLKAQQFIEAARTAGSTNARVIWRHIIPNLFSIVFIASTLNIANVIIGEASISLLGLGVRPPGSSIGLMIADGTTTITVYPWETLLPAMVLAIIVLSFSFLGDGLRDAFDPHTKDQ
jgi:oligopeptide transport system permease protein